MFEVNDYNRELKRKGIQCLFFYLEQCQACNDIKPKVEELSTRYPKVVFSKISLSKEENITLYKRFYSDPQPLVKLSTHDDGEPILDYMGKPLVDYVRDDKGAIVTDTPVSAPHFFIFHNETATEEDEFGFLGEVKGDIAVLDNILSELDKVFHE